MHKLKDFKNAYEEGKLLGLKCEKCNKTWVTHTVVCPYCKSKSLETIELSHEGIVISYTIQSIASDKFFNEAPFAYVLVELDGGNRISGWMPEVKSPDGIRIGDRVRYTKTYLPGIVFERVR